MQNFTSSHRTPRDFVLGCYGTTAIVGAREQKQNTHFVTQLCHLVGVRKEASGTSGGAFKLLYIEMTAKYNHKVSSLQIKDKKETNDLSQVVYVKKIDKSQSSDIFICYVQYSISSNKHFMTDNIKQYIYIQNMICPFGTSIQCLIIYIGKHNRELKRQKVINIVWRAGGRTGFQWNAENRQT